MATVKASTAVVIRKRIDQLRAAGYSDERIATHLEAETPRLDGRRWTATLVVEWMRDNAAVVGYIAATPPRSSHTRPHSAIET